MTPKLTAVLSATALVMVCAHARADELTKPPAAAPTPPAAPTAAVPAGESAPADQAVPPVAADQPAAPGEDDLEMHVTATRPVDMESFAKASAQETRIVGSKTRYSLNFFGDAFANAIGGTRTTTKPSFGVGSFSFIFVGELGNSIKATAEPAMEFDDTNATVLDLERLHVRYTKSGFWVEAGRSHVDLGYWNVAYHHGKWLQPTVERPRTVHFEDQSGLLPIHWVGAQIGYAAALSRQMTLTSSIAVGNGRGAIVDDIQSGIDKRPEKQGYAKIELKGLGHRDLRLGVAGVYGRIASQDATVRPSLPDTTMGEVIGNVYVAFPSDPFLAIAEGYVISHSGLQRTWETYAAFVVLGYAFLPVTPYVKLERIVMTNGSDPFFVPDVATTTSELDVYEGYAGLRIDVSTWSALKTEYRLTRTLREDLRTIHEGILSWQFGI